MTNLRREEYVRLLARMEITLEKAEIQLQWAQSRAVDRHRMAAIVQVRNAIAEDCREMRRLFPIQDIQYSVIK